MGAVLFCSGRARDEQFRKIRAHRSPCTRGQNRDFLDRFYGRPGGVSVKSQVGGPSSRTPGREALKAVEKRAILSTGHFQHPQSVEKVAIPSRGALSWSGFRVRGELDFSLVGILADLSRVLAAAKVGIFAVSTYDTDYILTKSTDFDRALDALQRAGHEVLRLG